MPFTITITDAGRAALVNAEHTGTAPVAISHIGVTQTAVAPDPAATALAGELKRVATISGEVVAPDTIHVTMFDDGADAYSLRGFGVYLADGTLFALYGQADPIIVKTAASIASLAVDVQFVDVDATSVTFGDTTLSNPPATTERQGVVELATVPEAQAGIDALRALTPASARAAVLGWILAQDGAGSGLDADMLDGQHGSYYANIPARLGYTPLDVAAFTNAAVLARLLPVDGAGSGLDADLLDGFHAAAFDRIVSASLIERGGFIVYADGRKECWGWITINAGGYADFALPVAHTAFVNVSMAPDVVPGNSDQQDNVGPTAIIGAPPIGVRFYSASNSTRKVWVRTIGV